LGSYDKLFPWTDFSIEAWIQSPKSNQDLVPVVSLGLNTNFASFFVFGYFNGKLTYGSGDADGITRYIFGSTVLTPGMSIQLAPFYSLALICFYMMQGCLTSLFSSRKEQLERFI
jgi:hypothetical protein